MKKILLLTIAVCLIGFAQAQITLTSSSVGPVGSTFYVAVDTSLPAGYDIGQPGTNLTWDFSQLNQDYYDTIRYLAPASTPHAADFPTSNLAVERALELSAYAYFELDSTQFLLLGFAADPFQLGTPFVVHQTPPSKSAIFPYTYGSTIQDTSTFAIRMDGSFLGIPGVDSVEFISTTIRDVVCDSWGSLILWGNTYNALRNKEIRNTHDVANGRFFGVWTNFQDTTYTDSTFMWLNDTKGYTLAEAEYIGGVLDQITYQDANPVGVRAAVNEGFVLYPNPATGQVIVSCESNLLSSLRVYNLQGQLLIEQAASGQRAEISLQGIAPGMVLVQGLDAEGRILMSQKLAVR